MNANLEELVKEINAVNLAWKEASEMGDCLNRISQSLSQLKARLQVRLLRQYAPDCVYLQLDTDNQDTQGEELYGLILRQPTNPYWNAAHLPVRVARNVLSEQELQQFIQH